MRAVSVLYQLSINVPKAIAVAKTINKTDINRVEKKNFFRSAFMENKPLEFWYAKVRSFKTKKNLSSLKRQTKDVNYFL